MNSQKIINVANATLATDALNRQTGDGRYYLATTRLNQILPPAANFSMNLYKITSLFTPSAANDAANKAYVDSRAPYRNAFILVGTLNLSTTPVTIDPISSINGFVTSATK